jgi:hypothetical protein
MKRKDVERNEVCEKVHPFEKVTCQREEIK